MIYGIETAPSWFDLKQYKSSIKLSSLEWIIQIALRQIQRNFFQPIFFTGIVQGWSPTFETRSLEPDVEYLKVQDAKLIAEYLSKQPDTKKINNEGLLNHYIPVPLYHGLIRLDLKACDDVIIKRVKRWLKTFRASQKAPPRPRYGPVIFQRWVMHHALPYLDLKYWSKLHGNKLTNTQLAQILYPSDDPANATARISQTTRKYAEELLNYACLYGLISEYEETHSKRPIIPDVIDLITLGLDNAIGVETNKATHSTTTNDT